MSVERALLIAKQTIMQSSSKKEDDINALMCLSVGKHNICANFKYTNRELFYAALMQAIESKGTWYIQGFIDLGAILATRRAIKKALLGEIVMIDGKLYKVHWRKPHNSNACSQRCALWGTRYCNFVPCKADQRDDNSNIYFIAIEEGENSK